MIRKMDRGRNGEREWVEEGRGRKWIRRGGIAKKMVDGRWKRGAGDEKRGNRKKERIILRKERKQRGKWWMEENERKKIEKNTKIKEKDEKREIQYKMGENSGEDGG